MRRDIGNVDLKNGPSLSFLRHGERCEQGNKHRQRQHKNARPRYNYPTIRVEPEPNRGLHWLGSRCVGGVISLYDAARVTRHQPGRVRVRGVHQQLDRRIAPAHNVPSEVNRNDEDGVRAVLQGLFRRLLHRRRGDVQVTEARKASISLRDAAETVQVLYHNRKVAHRQLEGCPIRNTIITGRTSAIASDMRSRTNWVSSLRICARIRRMGRTVSLPPPPSLVAAPAPPH